MSLTDEEKLALRPVAVVRWEDAQGKVSVVQMSAAMGTVQDGELDLSLVQRGDSWRLVAAPSREGIRVTQVRVRLCVDLAHADALYLNGYNSWTDSVEHSPRDAMKNFGVPRAAVDHWALDGSGDYRFTPRDERRGHQHGFAYGYLRFGDQVQLVGSLGEDSGLTTIYEDYDAGTLTLDKEAPAGELAAGVSSELLSFCVVKGDLRSATQTWLDLDGIKARSARPMVGYTSWYRHYTDIDAGKLEHDLEGVAQELGRFQTGSCARVFQIDDGYTKVGDWTTPDAGKFPQGMAPLVQRIKEADLVPGIWLAPFVCERESRVFADHQDWLLHDDKGQLVTTGSHWSGQVALDTLNPQVRDHLRQVLSTYTRDWGFKLLKCDFLYAACMLPHGGMNRGQLIADALDLIRSSVAEGTWLDFCGVPLASAFGRCEFCRVGCDVGLDWDDKPHMRLTGRERVSTKNNLANTHGRAHLDGLAFRNDPDVFFLRSDVKLSDEQRSALLRADATLGGVFFTSDDMGLWDQEQSGWYREALAAFVGRAQKESGAENADSLLRRLR